MFQTILVATDGSDHGRKATRMAGHLAGKYGAKLVVAHVVTGQPVPDSLRRMAEVEHLVESPADKSGSSLGRLSIKPSATVADRRLAAVVGAKVLEQAAHLARDEGAGRVETVELEGKAAEALVEAATRHGADLVVIGSRGFGAIGRLVHGSVSTEVSHAVRCPCLVVK
jgi:nucleotide-binding universal stress UspA family protein